MNTYQNEKSGVIITVDCEIVGGGWKLITDVSATEEKPEPKKKAPRKKVIE